MFEFMKDQQVDDQLKHIFDPLPDVEYSQENSYYDTNQHEGNYDSQYQEDYDANYEGNNNYGEYPYDNQEYYGWSECIIVYYKSCITL